MVEAAWVADTQLQLSQLSYLDADTADDAMDVPAELESQAQPVEISSNDEISDRNSDNEISDPHSDNEPRRSGRVKRPTVALES